MVLRFGSKFGMRKETEDAQPVIDGDNHNAFARQSFSIIGARTGVTACEASTVNPYHDRQIGLGRFGCCPDVQVKTIFTERRQFAAIKYSSRWIRCLPACLRELLCFSYTFPRRGRLWLLPAQVTDGWRSEWNSPIDTNIRLFAGSAGEQALLDLYGISNLRGRSRGQHEYGNKDGYISAPAM